MLFVPNVLWVSGGDLTVILEEVGTGIDSRFVHSWGVGWLTVNDAEGYQQF